MPLFAVIVARDLFKNMLAIPTLSDVKIEFSINRLLPEFPAPPEYIEAPWVAVLPLNTESVT